MCVKLAVGDFVVYANHGTGSVAAREMQTVLDGTREVVVVELDEGLTVTLPLELAQQLLRPLASAHIYAPLPRCATITRPFAVSGAI